MSGIARAAALLLAWSTMTRWLQRVGLALTVIGAAAALATTRGAAPSLAIVFVILGVITTTISPVLMAAIVFRSLSAPRVVALIPRGRLQLLLGVCVSQLLLAAFIGGAIAVGTHGSVPLLPLFGGIWALLTLHFIGFYLVAPTRLSTLWLVSWSLWARLAAAVWQYPRLHDALLSTAGALVLLLLVLLAWLAFGVGYLRSPRIRLPHWSTFGGAARPTAASRAPVRTASTHRFARHEALRAVLTDGPRQGRALMGLAAIVCIVVLAALMIGGHLPRGGSYSIVGLVCMMAGPVTGSFAGAMAQRVKPLWLQSGLSRTELFLAVEARSWWIVLSAVAVCAALLGSLLMLDGQPLALTGWGVSALLTPLVSGAMFIYAQLQFVRGRRLLDIAIQGLAIALWILEFFNGVVGAALPVVVSLLGVQVLLVPLLRLLALRRWQRIDWLIHRRTRTAWGTV